MVRGGSFEKNNIGTEDTAERMAYIIFDIRGLSEQEKRTILMNIKI